MNCETIKNDIPPFLAEDLPESKRRQMERHLRVCSRCRHEKEELQRIWELLNHVEIDEPSGNVKANLMAAAEMELQHGPVPWRQMLAGPSFLKPAFSALGLSLIIYLLFPYAGIIELCEVKLFNDGLLAVLPRDFTYFVLGLMYGLSPVVIAELCWSRVVPYRPAFTGVCVGFATSAFMIPFLFVRCPQFTSGILTVMALGILTGTVSAGAATFLVIKTFRPAPS